MAQIYFFYWDYPYNLQKKLVTLKLIWYKGSLFATLCKR